MRMSDFVDRMNAGHEGLTYEPNTGRLFRIIELTSHRVNDTQVAVAKYTFGGRVRPVTHIITYLMTGSFPQEGHVIDHRDGNPTNNKWDNLREATLAQNSRNADRGYARWNTKMGMATGVGFVAKNTYKKFHVRIRGISYGYYHTVEEANSVAKRAYLELNDEFDFTNRGKDIKP